MMVISCDVILDSAWTLLPVTLYSIIAIIIIINSTFNMLFRVHIIKSYISIKNMFFCKDQQVKSLSLNQQPMVVR